MWSGSCRAAARNSLAASLPPPDRAGWRGVRLGGGKGGHGSQGPQPPPVHTAGAAGRAPREERTQVQSVSVAGGAGVLQEVSGPGARPSGLLFWGCRRSWKDRDCPRLHSGVPVCSEGLTPTLTSPFRNSGAQVYFIIQNFPAFRKE